MNSLCLELVSLGLTPFAGLCFTLTALGTLLVNLHFGWLAAAIAGAVFLVLLLVTGMFNRQWSTFVQYNATLGEGFGRGGSRASAAGLLLKRVEEKRSLSRDIMHIRVDPRYNIRWGDSEKGT